MNDIVTIDQEKAPALINKSSNIMNMITSAITSGSGIDVVSKLMDLQERYEKNEARKSFDIAMSKAMAEIPEITKGNEVKFGNTNYRYEDLASITKIVRPILSKYGLSHRFRTDQTNSQVSVTCIISHEDGHFEENTLSAANDTTGNKNGIQAIGSAVTYLERYTLKAALGLAAANDDDGNSFENLQKKDTNEKISKEQVQEILNFINEYEINIQGFCKYFRVNSVSELPLSQFDSAMKAIEKSIKNKIKEEMKERDNA